MSASNKKLPVSITKLVVSPVYVGSDMVMSDPHGLVRVRAMKYLDGKRTGKNNWFFKPQVARTSFCVPTRCQSGSHRRRVGENDGTPIFAEVMWTDARQRLVPSRGNHL
jgi:hypothetical protein